MRFMVHDATQAELLAACVHNNVMWMRRLVEAGGGDLFQEDGLEWAATWQPGREITALVTQPPDPALRGRIDAIGEYGRANNVEVVSYWAMDATWAGPLDVWLYARGFRSGGRPHWMAVDRATYPETAAGESEMTFPDTFDDHTVPDLLCYNPMSRQIRQALVSRQPQRVWHAVWWRSGSPIGTLSINLTEGDLGVGGIHDLYFLADARTPGIGKHSSNALERNWACPPKRWKARARRCKAPTSWSPRPTSASRSCAANGSPRARTSSRS